MLQSNWKEHVPGEGNSSRNQSRRSAGVVSALLFAATIILAILRNSAVVLVVALYGCIVLEGISVSVFMMYSKSDAGYSFDDVVKKGKSGGKGNDIVDSMNVYVKYASRGSDHSRREIARTIKNVLESDASKKYGNLSTDRVFLSDLESIVNPFVNIGKVPEKRKRRTKMSRRDSEAYLTSLERIVQKLVDR